MAIPTFVAGNVLTAAQLNTISTALTITDAWTNYTPTLLQGVTVTKTTTYARYIKVGRLVQVQMRLDCTSAGTANTTIVVGLPSFVPVAAADGPLGVGWCFDASSGFYTTGFVVVDNTTRVKFLAVPAGSGTVAISYLGQTAAGGPTLASTDAILASFCYESTT